MNKGRRQAAKASRKALAERGPKNGPRVPQATLNSEDLRRKLVLDRSAHQGSARPKKRKTDQRGGGNRTRYAYA